MPITKMNVSALQKKVKKDLVSHITELYDFIDLFDNSDEVMKAKQELKDFKQEYFNGLEKLRDENKVLNSGNGLLKGEICNRGREIDKLNEEYEKLKEEDWTKKYALKIDYQKILDENKILKRCKGQYKCESKYWFDEHEILEEKYKDLNVSYKYGTLGTDGVHIPLNKQGDRYYDDNTAKEMLELKKQNEKLQEHLDKAREVSNKLIGENNTTMPSQSCLYRENKKLKEEIDKYKDLIGDFPLEDLEECINTYMNGDNYIDECKLLQNSLDNQEEENKKLNEEVKELKGKCEELEYQYKCLVDGDEGY